MDKKFNATKIKEEIIKTHSFKKARWVERVFLRVVVALVGRR